MLRPQHVLGAFRRLPLGKNSFERCNLSSRWSSFHAAPFSTCGGREDDRRNDPSLSEKSQHIGSYRPEDFRRLVKRGRQSHKSHEEENEALIDDALGPPTTQDLAIEKQLSAEQLSPAVIFRQCVDEGTASIRVVNSCMLAYKRKVDSFPRRQRQQLYDEIRQDGMARSVLRYLWSDNSLWHTYLSISRQTRLPLVLCALLEGLEEVIEKWMEVDVHIDGDDHQGRHAWRGDLLRHLVAAHAFLDTTLCADGFLKAILTAHNRVEREWARYDTMKMTQENPPLPAVLNASMWPALLQGFLELTRYGLGPRGWYNTSPELYDRFVSLISETAKLDQYEREMYLARLDLCHPQRKNDVAAIAILEKFMANKENALKCQLDDKPSSGPYSKRVASVLGFMQHTAGVADYLEHHDKASWIRNEVMKKFEQEHGQDDSHAASNSKQDKPSIYSR